MSLLLHTNSQGSWHSVSGDCKDLRGGVLTIYGRVGFDWHVGVVFQRRTTQVDLQDGSSKSVGNHLFL